MVKKSNGNVSNGNAIHYMVKKSNGNVIHYMVKKSNGNGNWRITM